MPTARELLEQADALMRRNRVASGGDAARAAPAPGPITLSPTSGFPASPRTIQREPIPPAVARTSLPVDPTDSPALNAAAPKVEPRQAGRVDAPLAQPPADADAEFPLLTEAVEAPASPPADGPLDDLTDDVPVLTDAVEEIDVGTVVDEATSGEPSIWELTARGETSVLGPVPDSIVVVPPPEPVPPAVPQSPPAGRDPLGLDQPPPGYTGSDAADHRPPNDQGAESALRSDEGATASADASALDEASTPSPQEVEPFPPPSSAQAWADDSRSGDPPGPAVPAAQPPGEDAQAFDARDVFVEASAAPAPPSPPQVSELDQQRIREIAEEIGMQVLQRIDIFTDTTLRAQLGERLRPVVDRAAADLVAAINEHVGELLRAYISEAIEREIESWRHRR